MGKFEDLVWMQVTKYFIIQKGYKPVVFDSGKNEIFLERMEDKEIQLIRITPNPITFEAQVEADEKRIEQIIKKLKRKALVRKIKAINIYTGQGKVVSKSIDIKSVSVNTKNSLKNSLSSYYSDIESALYYVEDQDKEIGIITEEIKEHNIRQAVKAKKFFKNRYVSLAKIIPAVLFMSLFYIAIVPMELNGLDEFQSVMTHGVLNKSLVFGAGEWYRLFTYQLISVSPWSLALSVIVIYRITPIIEQMYGRMKVVAIIMFGSALGGLALILALPTGFFAGPMTIWGAMIGAMIHFVVSNKVMFLQMFWPKFKKALLPIVLSMLFVTAPVLMGFVMSIVGGYFVALIISWKGKTSSMFELTYGVIAAATIVVGMVGIEWTTGPKRTEYMALPVEMFDGYKTLGYEYEHIAEKICAYYKVKEGECKW